MNEDIEQERRRERIEENDDEYWLQLDPFCDFDEDLEDEEEEEEFEAGDFEDDEEL